MHVENIIFDILPVRPGDVFLVYDRRTIVVERSVSWSELTSPGVRIVVEGLIYVFVFVDVRSLWVGGPSITVVAVRVGGMRGFVAISVNVVLLLLVQVLQGLLVQALGHVLQGDGGEVRGSVSLREAAQLVA